jgi:hypothetical protein
MAEAKSPGWARLRCETTCTLEYLHQITRELENTPWSCSWEILPDLDEQQKVTEEIPEMDTEDPRPPSPTDRPTTPNPPDRPAKKEERADLELRAFRIQVEARKQRRKGRGSASDPPLQNGTISREILPALGLGPHTRKHVRNTRGRRGVSSLIVLIILDCCRNKIDG